MEIKVDQLTTYNRNLEIQMGQLANAFNSRGQDALAQIPAYAKFLKEIMSNKRKLEDYETIALTEECSAVIQNKLPLIDVKNDLITREVFKLENPKEPLEKCLVSVGTTNDENLEVAEMTYALEDTRTKPRRKVEAGVGICTNHGCTRLEFTV
ncbi:hypothetical protein NE237_018945 [Protea cynaroides]|uniref:Uncharacterized protein n=1 Tax=Protea cynaroides TaxID=273540 RepID=A0A9Q0KB19_9MAGN|nr:hypothetical protein NE237_018945 [Protea cynaroides]